jgi:hypothetical protein
MDNTKHLAPLLLAAIALFPVDALAAGQLAPAPAPYAPPPPTVQARPSPERDGFTFGIALGGGQLKLDDETVQADATGGLSLRAGLALSQSFLLQATFDATRAQNNDAHGNSNGALQLDFYGVSATGYLLPRLYLSVGLGYASIEVEDKHMTSDLQKADSLALLVGTGLELIQTSGFALSLEVRGFGASFDNRKAVGGNVLLGLQWF